MKYLYDKEDILTYKTDEIPLGTTVIIKTKWDAYKGKLILNNEDCIAIDYPKELKGTYLSRDAIKSIRVLGSFSDLMNLITKKDGDKMDKNFIQAVKNIQTYIDKCGIKILINECKYDKSWTYRYKEPWYTFKVADENSQDIEYEVSLPAIEDFQDETIIYLNGSKWYVKNALITNDTIIGTLEGDIEKCNEDKEYYEDLLNKYKSR